MGGARREQLIGEEPFAPIWEREMPREPDHEE
jgi:hypothetical protein